MIQHPAARSTGVLTPEFVAPVVAQHRGGADTASVYVVGGGRSELRCLATTAPTSTNRRRQDVAARWAEITDLSARKLLIQVVEVNEGLCRKELSGPSGMVYTDIDVSGGGGKVVIDVRPPASVADQGARE